MQSAIHLSGDDCRRHAHAEGTSLNRVALMATLHCLDGCAVGEVPAWSSARHSAGATPEQ